MATSKSQIKITICQQPRKMLSAEHREYAKRSTFFKVYLVETVIQQGYKPSIFQQWVFCLIVSYWCQRERNLVTDWTEHNSTCLKVTLKWKHSVSFIQRKNYESFQNSNKRRQYFPIQQKYYNWGSLAMKHLQNRSLQQIKDFLQYFIITHIKQYSNCKLNHSEVMKLQN